MIRKSCAILWTSLWFTLFFYLEVRHFSMNVLFFFLGCIAVGSVLAIVGGQLQGRINLFAWDDRITDLMRSALSDRELLFNAWVIILLCWIPSWLAFFPGTLGYDSPTQLSMYMGETELTSAQPLAHTWILGGIISLGKAVFGSYQAGFILFIILQLLLLSNCMANMVLFLIRKHVPLTVTLIGLLWTITHPVIQVLNLNTTKDILVGAFLAFFVMAFWDIVEEKEERKISEYAKVFFFGLMLCLMRNAMMLLLVALLVISLLFRLKDKKIYLTLLSVVVCVEAFSLLCGSVFRIPKGDMREYLCIPIQQMAATIYEHQNGTIQIDEADLEGLEELFADIERIGLEYESDSVDKSKLLFQTEVFKSDPGKYISLYFRLGAQNSKIYHDAVTILILPYWHMEANAYRGLAFTYTFSELNSWDIQPKYLEMLEGYRVRLMEGIETDHYSFWRQPGLCIWLLVALTGLMIARKEKRGFLKILLIPLYFAGILMGPVALLRYLYPIMLTTPLLFGMLFRRREAE